MEPNKLNKIDFYTQKLYLFSISLVCDVCDVYDVCDAKNFCDVCDARDARDGVWPGLGKA